MRIKSSTTKRAFQGDAEGYRTLVEFHPKKVVSGTCPKERENLGRISRRDSNIQMAPDQGTNRNSNQR